MADSYTVTRHRHGIVVEGPFPVCDLAALLPAWAERYGWTLCDSLISGKLGASLVVTDREHGDAWRRELGAVP